MIADEHIREFGMYKCSKRMDAGTNWSLYLFGCIYVFCRAMRYTCKFQINGIVRETVGFFEGDDMGCALWVGAQSEIGEYRSSWQYVMGER